MNGFINQLISAGIEENEAKKEIAILFSEFGKNNTEKIKNIVDERIKTRTPIQYLLGKAYFMDFEVKVNPKVLIPRPETEVLVEESVRRGKLRLAPTAIDIGTGSGIIAIALAKLIPNIKIVAIDVEKEIIDLAKENAIKNNVNEKINFKVCDLFSKCAEELFKSNKFDFIISNPPYISVRTTGRLSLQPEIIHEPEIALHGSRENKKGLIYYERIIELCRCRGNWPVAPTIIALEIDPPLVNDLKNLLKKNNLNNFEVIKDYAGLERCLFIVF